MKKAKIFLVDDDNELIEKICENLEDHGHSVLVVKNSLRGAKDSIKDCELGGINIAIIDSYFPNEAGGNNLHFNGPILEREIKREYPKIITIIFGSLQPEKNKYGDHYIWKRNGIEALIEAIEKL